MKPTEVFDYGRTVYEYIKQTPLVTRGGLNSHYRTSSNDQRNRNLTWVLEALLARQYVFKYTDPETAQVTFWVHEYTRSPHQPDPTPELSYVPVDVFGKRPVNPVEPPKTAVNPLADEPMGDPVGTPPAQPPATPVVSADETRLLMERTCSKLNGALRAFYKVMMEKPCGLFSKTDKQFEELVPSMPDRARFLGRMFGIGAIRRFKDPLDKRVAYYTIFGECPLSMVEDTSALSHAERKKVAERIKAPLAKEPAAASEQIPDSFPPSDIDEEDLSQDVEEDEQQDADSVGETDGVTPTAFLGNDGSFMMQRADGTMDEFDLDESMAIVELFLMTNHEALKERLAKMKAAQ